MMLHIAGKTCTSKITGIHPEDVQPNAIDLRIDRVFALSSGEFVINNEEKTHRNTREILPTSLGWFTLQVGYYQIIMENTITIGPDEAGFVIPRSTLVRNGLSIITGLYDSGYSGMMQSGLNVEGGTARIQRGTRIAQFLLFKAESLTQYDGDYGFNKNFDKQYEVK
jgi:deoxycytidine triphosphate deaminase